MTLEHSDKSRLTTLLLASLLGPFGAHRFYTGRPRSGVLMLLTLGGLGIWYLYDVIVIASGGYVDGDGRLVSRWEEEPGTLPAPGPELLAELDALRAEVAELAERVDFTERLLASPRPPDRAD
jgi:TM2 domain-containing membrane protein YozV